MRVNTDRKTIDMEARDINYALGAYVISYLYASKNEDPKEIIFPKFPAIPHPRTPGVLIPIRYVEIDEPIVQEIIEDGKDIPEKQIVEVPREEQTAEEAVDKDPKEDVPILKDENITPNKESAEELSPAKAALKNLQATSGRIENVDSNIKSAKRKPKMPASGDIGVGHPDGIGSKDAGFERKIISDLKPEARVDESKELNTDIEKPND